MEENQEVIQEVQEKNNVCTVCGDDIDLEYSICGMCYDDMAYELELKEKDYDPTKK